MKQKKQKPGVLKPVCKASLPLISLEMSAVQYMSKGGVSPSQDSAESRLAAAHQERQEYKNAKKKYNSQHISI